MIYLDTSVVLAQLLAEDRRPPVELWQNDLVSSRLLVFEVWNRINARNLTLSHGSAVQSLVGRLAILELFPAVLERALEPFPIPVRTLDGLHLASIDFLVRHQQKVTVASYDLRFLKAAVTLGFQVEDSL